MWLVLLLCCYACAVLPCSCYASPWLMEGLCYVIMLVLCYVSMACGRVVMCCCACVVLCVHGCAYAVLCVHSFAYYSSMCGKNKIKKHHCVRKCTYLIKVLFLILMV
ncbi:hypothetical protein I3842_08G031800 [Carya illinoinensis]|uniref:NADH dehydrogenase subunit 6 n=1 Tax=Carya illinoinensis TaxID=32201 RepID=A0A922E879_CARIL|nr:hypothetical protein I3842_08G031800 [Carya illinoinensis]